MYRSNIPTSYILHNNDPVGWAYKMSTVGYKLLFPLPITLPFYEANEKIVAFCHLVKCYLHTPYSI